MYGTLCLPFTTFKDSCDTYFIGREYTDCGRIQIPKIKSTSGMFPISDAHTYMGHLLQMSPNHSFPLTRTVRVISFWIILVNKKQSSRSIQSSVIFENVENICKISCNGNIIFYTAFVQHMY